MSKVDLGNLCVHCRNDTSFGSGRFVNRYPVFDLDVDGNGIEETGYCCDECEQEWYEEEKESIAIARLETDDEEDIEEGKRMIKELFADKKISKARYEELIEVEEVE